MKKIILTCIAVLILGFFLVPVFTLQKPTCAYMGRYPGDPMGCGSGIFKVTGYQFLKDKVLN